MKIIDGDELINSRVFLCGGPATDPYYNGYADALDRVSEAIEQLPSINAVVLPCKIGDTVYQPGYRFTACSAYEYTPRCLDDSGCEGCEAECDSKCYPVISVGTVSEMRILSSGTITVKVRFTDKWDNSSYIVGTSVFLTKEAAEAAFDKLEIAQEDWQWI